jgi:hypothetical protein
METPEISVYRKLVQEAGCIYVGIQRGYGVVPDSVLFQRSFGETTMAIYCTALRSVEDIHLAIKSKYQMTRSFGDMGRQF